MLDISGSITFASKIVARHRSLGQSLCIIVFLVGTAHAKTEVFFSPDGLIRDNIVKAIHASGKSVDIAVLIFSAGEIAEALYEAKERGVKVRIILDHKQKKKDHPVVEFLKEEGFCLQFLKGKIGGSMNNRFAIFDSEIVVTGSYHWSEYSEKYNYENAVFVDDADVIKKFQEEFDFLYEKCLVEREQGGEVGVLAEEMPSTAGGKNSHDSEVQSGSKEHTVPDESIPTVLDISFKEFDNLFGKRGTLGRAERKRVWRDQFEGKYVKWTGEIGYKGIAVYDWNKIGIRHKDNSIDVQLRVDWTKKRQLMNVVMGDIITYRGRLVSLGGFMAPYKLDDVDVLDVQ